MIRRRLAKGVRQVSEEGRQQEGREDSEDRGPDRAREAPGLSVTALPTSLLIHSFVATLTAKAWEAMGLVANPVTRQVQKSLPDAQLAIDAIAALVGVVRDSLSPEERREIETVLTDLRLNFVNQSKT